MDKDEKTKKEPEQKELTRMQQVQADYKKKCKEYETLIRQTKKKPLTDKATIDAHTEKCRAALQAKRDAAKAVEDIKFNRVK